MQKSNDKGKSVFKSSQSQHGRVDLTLYECGRKAMDAGAISLGDMTIEAALVKLMLLTGNFTNRNKLVQVMLHPLAGELSA